MRRRILAELAEPAAAPDPEASEPVPAVDTAAGPAPARTAKPPRGAGSRLAVAAVAVLCLLVSLSGMSLLMSRNALPGDDLYTIKRTAEAAELGLTFSERPRALKHLEFAASRVGEIEALRAKQQGGPAEPAEHYLTALGYFESDAAAGAQLLTTLGAQSDAKMLESLGSWAHDQAGRLRETGAALPSAAHPKIASTLELLRRIHQRAIDLRERLSCLSVTSGVRDEIGALPAADRCVPAPVRDIPVQNNGSTAQLPSLSGRAPSGQVPPTGTAAASPAAPVEPTVPAPPVLPLVPPSAPAPTTAPPNPTGPTTPALTTATTPAPWWPLPTWLIPPPR